MAIERVERQLLIWADQVRGGMGGCGESPFGALIRNGGVFSPPGKGCVIPIDDRCMIVEAAVNKLPAELRELVVLRYQRELSLQMCARRLCVRKVIASDYLDAAHVLLDDELFGAAAPRVA